MKALDDVIKYLNEEEGQVAVSTHYVQGRRCSQDHVNHFEWIKYLQLEINLVKYSFNNVRDILFTHDTMLT